MFILDGNLNIKLITKIIICLLVLTISIPISADVKAEAATDGNYLVLIQNKDKSWTAYENLLEKTAEGRLMIKAKKISEALNFTYINDGEEFTIQRGYYRFNTYAKGEQSYSFKCSSSLSVLKKAKVAPYTSKRSNYNMCHIDTLGTMVNYKYFMSSKATDYKEKGYKGVLCYSLYEAITEVPALDKVLTPKQGKFFADAEPEEQNNIETDNNAIEEFPVNKLIIVGDSRTNNMSKWVKTIVDTEFVAKNGKGYLWFVEDGINEVNKIKNPGDVILIWLGVNDYFSTEIGDNTILTYANKINNLAENEWYDCKVYVAEVGYVDTTLLNNYYGVVKRANVTQLSSINQIKGIKGFNDYLSGFLCNKITWITTNELIGINANDSESTPDELWITRDNGLKDGLHYGETKSDELYQYFVEKTMNYY